MPRTCHNLLLFSLLVPCMLGAAELSLKNGDKLSGTIIRREQGIIVLRHTLLGELRLPESELAALHEDAPAAPGAATPPPPSLASGTQPDSQTPPIAQAPQASPATTKPKAEDEDDESKQHTHLKGWRRVLADTTGSIEFGYQSQDGRKNATNTSLRAYAEYKNAPDAYRFEWRYYYGEYNEVIQTDKKDWTFRWRHELNRRWFSQTITSYDSDRIKHIDMNLQQSAGVGYAAMMTNRNKLNIGAGVIGQHRIIEGQDTGLIALGQIFEDYTWRINKRFTFTQESSAQYSPIRRQGFTTINGQLVQAKDDASNYRYTFGAALKGKISDKFSMNLRYEYEFDNSVVEDEFKGDRRISTTLGYTF